MRGRGSYVVEFAEECEPKSPKDLAGWFRSEWENAGIGHRRLLNTAVGIAEIVASQFNVLSPLRSSQEAMKHAAETILGVARMEAQHPLRGLHIQLLVLYLQYDQTLERKIERHLIDAAR